MRLRRWAEAAFLLVAASFLAATASAQLIGPSPKEVEDVRIDAKLGAQVPLDRPFMNSDGKKVKLGDLFDQKRSVILTLNYSNCPMLCSLQLNGLFTGLGEMPWNLGEQFQMITMSIDPKESPERARLTKQKYLKLYGRPGVAAGWHCLTGEEQNIRSLADAVGFRYRYDPQTGQYYHAASTIILTPDGRVSRYLNGVEYDPQTIRLSLVEAADGKIGSMMDQLILLCFHYDENRGRYGAAAETLMRVASVAAVLGVLGMIVVFWRKSAVRERSQAAEERHVVGAGSS